MVFFSLLPTIVVPFLTGFKCIEKVWGLRVQEVKPEYKEKLYSISLLIGNDWEVRKHEVKPDWFGDFDQETNTWYWVKFEKGKNITWQQWLFFAAFEAALRGETPRKIAIESGVGTGKSSSLAMLMIQ